ncbi:helix-turn-helix transcriptional regulator, partial [Streptomyces sp. SID5606]|uniref:helix-turn-helix domain-containing protein n=1 Tax=Streptomyces sp. SID5606 TaxID=2690305 RepID=UPI0019289348
MPEELDPQIKEFTGQLRRLVDRSELSVASVADATGYSKTSWERYLNGRLLAPKGAIVALAEVTGTNPLHLTTMWELAERAWSRSEMRHDMTMEAIRISQARAALGDLGASTGKPVKDAKESKDAKPGNGAGGGRGSRSSGRHAGGAPVAGLA